MPAFYERDEAGLPQRWIELIRASLRTLGPDVLRQPDAGASTWRARTAAMEPAGSSGPATGGPEPAGGGARGPTYLAVGRISLPSRFCSMMWADQPAVRAQVNIGVNSSGGTSAKSSTTADQNSTLVASTRSGRRAWSSASAACLERLGHLHPGRVDLVRGAAQHPGARVLGAVDAVAEAHQPLAAVQHVLDVLLGVARLGHVVEHLQHA